MPNPLRTSAAALIGLVAGMLGYRVGRRRPERLPEAVIPVVENIPAPQLDARPAPGIALGEARRLPADVADRYRSARRAFGRCLHGFEPAALAELEELSMALWCAATCAEPFVANEAKRLRRGARGLCDDLGEHRRLSALAAAVGEQHGRAPSAAIDQVQARLARRQARLQTRIAERGRELFAAKPSRVSHELGEPHDR